MEANSIHQRWSFLSEMRAFCDAAAFLGLLAFCGAVLFDLFQAVKGDSERFRLLSLSANLTTITIFSLLVPITHWTGQLHNKKWRHFQPFKGGRRFVVFQGLSWTMYGLSVLLSLFWLVRVTQLACPHILASWLFSTFSGATGVLAQIFMISSLLVFEGPLSDCAETNSDYHNDQLSKTKLCMQEKNNQSFFTLHLLLALVAFALSVASDCAYWLGQHEFAFLCATLSSVKYAVANFNSYGLGGRLLHWQSHTWMFWQPFHGGTKFVALQALSWIVFGVSLALHLLSWISGKPYIGAMSVAGLLSISSQLLLILSLPTFSDEKQEPNSQKVKPCSISKFASTLVATMLVNSPYAPMLFMLIPCLASSLPTVECIIIVLGFFVWMMAATILGIGAFRMQQAKEWKISHRKQNLLCPPTAPFFFALQCSFVWMILLQLPPALVTLYLFQVKAVCWPTCLFLSCCVYLYMGTYIDRPELTGRRYLKTVNTNLCSLNLWHLPSFIAAFMQAHFQGKIIKTSELDSTQQYVFAMHPHGILPLTVTWLGHSLDWKQSFPGIHFHVLAATALHLVPGLRDFSQWCGSREVTEESILKLLDEGESILILPGGQNEMSYSHSNDETLRVTTRNSGFLRVSMQRGVAVVPILSFGECDFLDAVQIPLVQKWCIKACGVFFPLIPYGTFGLPIPRQSTVVVAIGKPVMPVKTAHPSRENILEFSKRYYEEVLFLFETCKKNNLHTKKHILLL